MPNLRAPILAGTWYPADPAVLARDVDGYIAAAEQGAHDARLKAIIAPHAGYRFSGPVAGSAYARVAAIAPRITRVVLVGPSHRHAFEGVAVPTASAFVSPLGEIALDADGIRDILRLPQVSALDEAHAREHSLEIHLPFLQRVLGDFTLVPLVVGRTATGAVAEVLANLWGGPETLIVISTDLSHYLDYETCRRLDARTSQAIVSGNIDGIGNDQACGRGGVKALLRLLEGTDATIDLLDLRNSGDTQGARDKVVGYGSWTVTEPEEGLADRRLLALGHGRLMLGIARAAIRQGLADGKPPSIAWNRVPAALKEDGAAFVTINLNGRLRGCIGSLVAHRPVADDIAQNAWKAAFKDPRFGPLTQEEFQRCEVEISLLSPHTPFPFRDEEDLIAQLRPGRDGLTLQEGSQRALFLPSVWDGIGDPRSFVRRLKQKAGWSPDYWSEGITATRFTTEKVSAGTIRAFAET
jgi:MEMO1 family protein